MFFLGNTTQFSQNLSSENDFWPLKSPPSGLSVCAVGGGGDGGERVEQETTLTLESRSAKQTMENKRSYWDFAQNANIQQLKLMPPTSTQCIAQEWQIPKLCGPQIGETRRNANASESSREREREHGLLGGLGVGRGGGQAARLATPSRSLPGRVGRNPLQNVFREAPFKTRFPGGLYPPPLWNLKWGPFWRGSLQPTKAHGETPPQGQLNWTSPFANSSELILWK